MRFLQAIPVGIRRQVARNLDLILAWLVLLGAQYAVPVDHYLGRDDLLPWMCASLSVVAILRGKRLGAGPHPMLTGRKSKFGMICQRGAMIVASWIVLAAHDLAFSLSIKDDLPLFAGTVIGLIVFQSMSGEQDKTAWNPPPYRGWLTWLVAIIVIGSMTAATGFFHGRMADNVWVAATAGAIVLGLSMLSVGLVPGRAQNHRQRVNAGWKDGSRYRGPLFPLFLAFVGPAGVFFVLFIVLPSMNFDFAFIVSLVVVVWGAIIWPVEEPVAVGCLLHEVQAVGGADAPRGETARPFHLPPQGAMRFSPVRTIRNMSIHPWLIPVKSSRIADLDDPVKPLWDVPPPPEGHHVLGDVAFEPDPLTKGAQWELATIRLKSQAGDDSLAQASSAKTQRVVILRPFPRSMRKQTRTYKWEQNIPEESVQVLDQTTETATLRSGDVIVLASEGVAHAYEFEVGAPIYKDIALFRARPPQMEDYTKAS
ncbi:MAG: hypothetical protein HN348_03540 [Proteobacteria bacterium]|jgi:hypothetical protein|nr:hypothetical protein [Pseudomonadota bacterium]